MYGKSVISGMIDEAFASKAHADKLLLMAGLDAQLLRGGAPIDDEVPPNGVTNLTATPIYAGVRLEWDEPPAEDVVRRAKIEITPEGGSTTTQVFLERLGATIFNLEALEYSFRVKLIDEWDLESAWSTVVTATPVTTADSDIDLAYKQANGTLQGLIDAINLSAPTAEEGVRANALASTLADNLLPLGESDIEIWTGAEWPPSTARFKDTINNLGVVVPGARIIDSVEPTGHTLDVTNFNRHKRIRHIRTTSSDNFVYYASVWNDVRRARSGQNHFAQATVNGSSGTTVSIAVQAATDANGTDPIILNENTVSLGGGDQKIHVQFTGSATHPYYRIRLGLHDDNATVYWYKFMVEEARTTATEPSPWNAGVIAAGSIGAHSLSAISANIASAVFDDAAIQSAAIKELKADKIIAGNLNANVIIANGRIEAEGAVIDNRGLYLKSQEVNPEGPDGTGANGFPTLVSVGDWITSNPSAGRAPLPYAGIGFFYDTFDKRRGILVTARGENDTNVDGYIRIIATSGGTNITAQTAAWVTIRAARPGGTGVVSIGQHLNVSGTIALANNAINSDEIAALDVRKLTGGGVGANVDPALLPEISRLRGRLSYGELANTPDLSNFVKDSELANKLQNLNFTTSGDVRRIVRDMVKASALS